MKHTQKEKAKTQSTTKRVFISIVLITGCICYTTFLSSSQVPMGAGPGMGMGPGSMGMGMPAGPLPPLTEADIAELENLYQSLTANMSPEEKDMLQKMGEDLMNQYSPQGPTQPKGPEMHGPVKPAMTQPTLPPLRPEGEIKENVPPMQQVSPTQRQHIQDELETFIKNLSHIQTMTETSADFAAALRQWLHDITELLYSIKVINKPEHYDRLGAPEFARLLKTIESMNKSFQQKAFGEACTRAEGCSLEPIEDPYATLGISPAASHKEIEASYKKMETKFKNAMQQTKLRGLTATEQEKSKRAAQFSFDLATNAYDLIKDPKTRAILDKEQAAKRAAEKSMHQSIRQLLEMINQELGSAIYNNQLLNDIDQFLKKYEPQQLEMRKKMEQAEAERIKEHKEKEQRKPIGKVVHVAKPASSWDMPWYPSQGGNYPYGGGAGGGYYPNMPHVGPGGQQPGKSSTPEAAKPGQTGGGTPGAGQPETEAEKQAAKEKDKTKQQTSGTDGKPAEQHITDKTVMDIYELDKTFKKFNDLFPNFDMITQKDDQVLPAEKIVLTDKTKEEVQEKIKDINEANEPTPAELLETVEGLKETIDDADQQHKASYQFYWNNLQNREPFEDNIKTLQKVLPAVIKNEPKSASQPTLTRGEAGPEPKPEQKIEKSPAQELYETMQTMQQHLKTITDQAKAAQPAKKTDKQNVQAPKKSKAGKKK